MFDFDERAHLHELAHKVDALFRLVVDLNRKADRTMAAIDDLKTSVAKFLADFETYRQTVKQAVDAAVVDALAKQAAGEAVDFTALKAQIDAADAEIAPAAAAVAAAG